MSNYKTHRLFELSSSCQAIRAHLLMQAYYRKHLGRDTKTTIIKVARKLLSRADTIEVIE